MLEAPIFVLFYDFAPRIRPITLFLDRLDWNDGSQVRRTLVDAITILISVYALDIASVPGVTHRVIVCLGTNQRLYSVLKV